MSGQDLHEVFAGRVGMTQYTLLAQQLERALRRSAATRAIDGADRDITVLWIVYRRAENLHIKSHDFNK